MLNATIRMQESIETQTEGENKKYSDCRDQVGSV